MKKENLEKCFRFILELENLKAVTRKVKPIGLERYENSAEHSWQITVLALVLGRYSDEEIDVEKVLKMLLLHDIGEIDAGDTIFFDAVGNTELKEKELEAVKRIFGILPEDTSKEFLEIWKEFEFSDSKEAKFARAIDRLMPVLQNLSNNRQSWDENDISKEQILTKTSYISDASELVWEMIAEKVEVAFEKAA
jgi:putative hydrolase of HD superfamily